MAKNPLARSTGKVPITERSRQNTRHPDETPTRPAGTEGSEARRWPGQDREDTSFRGWSVFKRRGATSRPGSHTSWGTWARTAVPRDLLNCFKGVPASGRWPSLQVERKAITCRRGAGARPQKLAQTASPPRSRAGSPVGKAVHCPSRLCSDSLRSKSKLLSEPDAEPRAVLTRTVSGPTPSRFRATCAQSPAASGTHDLPRAGRLFPGRGCREAVYKLTCEIPAQ